MTKSEIIIRALESAIKCKEIYIDTISDCHDDEMNKVREQSENLISAWEKELRRRGYTKKDPFEGMKSVSIEDISSGKWKESK